MRMVSVWGGRCRRSCVCCCVILATWLIVVVVSAVAAYQPPSCLQPNRNSVHSNSFPTRLHIHRRDTTTTTQHDHQAQSHAQHQKAIAVAALSSLLLLNGNPLPALASSTAAQISLNNLPPSSISVQIQDLPVLGNLLSGTYAKVADGSIKSPSVTISSPSDKVKALTEIASAGHLEFDVGGILSTHLDVDVSADEPGIAKVRVASGLIPKLPFKNLASNAATSPTGGKPTPWNMVTNMGSGETYYYNEKSGVTQYERPDLSLNPKK